MPDGLSLVACADDLAIVIANDVRFDKQTLDTVILIIGDWMRERGLGLAVHRTESMTMTTRKIESIVLITPAGIQVGTTEEIKQLGITLDINLTFWPYIKRVADEALDTVATFSRLMANT